MNRSTLNTAPAKVRIAVASKDNGLVNQHFGHAREFLIYDVDKNQTKLVEQRSVSQYCHGKEGEARDLNDIISILSDCQAILVAKIGAIPESRLKQSGIEPVQVYETIETALLNYYHQWANQQPK